MVTVFGLHQNPGIASPTFGKLASYVRISGKLVEFFDSFQESTTIHIYFTEIIMSCHVQIISDFHIFCVYINLYLYFSCHT